MKKLKAYVIHSGRQDIRPLTKMMSSEKVSVTDSFNILLSDNINTTILDCIRDAHFVVAVIDSDDPQAAFELGFATGIGKPVLLLVTPQISIPAFVSGYRYLVTDIKTTSVLKLGLRKFIRDVASGKRDGTKTQTKTRSLAVSRHKRPVSNNIVNEITRARQTRDAREVERLAAKILKESGINILEERHESSDKGADFVLWLESLRATIGNPIVVEVKAGALHLATISGALDQLNRYIARVDARAGLLLYLDWNNERFIDTHLQTQNLFIFDLEDLARLLSTTSLTSVLIERRNKIAHGLAR